MLGSDAKRASFKYRITRSQYSRALAQSRSSFRACDRSSDNNVFPFQQTERLRCADVPNQLRQLGDVCEPVAFSRMRLDRCQNQCAVSVSLEPQAQGVTRPARILAVTTRTISPSVGRKTSALQTCLTPPIPGLTHSPINASLAASRPHAPVNRGRCSSLRFRRDGLAPSTFRRSLGAPVHSINW